MHASNQIKLSLSHNIQQPNRFSCVLQWYGSDHPIFQEEVSMLKTISLTIYKVIKSYDGRENIWVANSYMSPPDIVD